MCFNLIMHQYLCYFRFPAIESAMAAAALIILRKKLSPSRPSDARRDLRSLPPSLSLPRLGRSITGRVGGKRAPWLAAAGSGSGMESGRDRTRDGADTQSAGLPAVADC